MLLFLKTTNQDAVAHFQ